METINLPPVIAALVKAQDNYDSVAYANCFSEMAVVVDEGKTYTGRKEIKQWIEKANNEFKTVMKATRYTETEDTSVLTAMVSGSFEGSPVVLNYHFRWSGGLIQSLQVTTV